MNWHYVLNERHLAPVDQRELNRLAVTGVITDATLVWREGMEN